MPGSGIKKTIKVKGSRKRGLVEFMRRAKAGSIGEWLYRWNPSTNDFEYQRIVFELCDGRIITYERGDLP